ncbi:MAG: deoxyribose-phosphate aldolase, partial [Opitutales bacterium]
MPPTLTRAELAAYIDHTILKPEATAAQVEVLCAEAREHGFAAVCVNPSRVALAAKVLAGSVVQVCTVAGFPLGATLPEAKATETQAAISAGATEVDMVLNVGVLKDGDHARVQADVAAVVEAAKGGASVKVILENCLLSPEAITQACLLCKEAGADYVKTSTGFGSSGAKVEDVKRMRAAVGLELGVKAAGGIRDTDTALAMIDAGATRIGASASIAILDGLGA